MKLPLTKRICLKIQNWQRWCLSLMPIGELFISMIRSWAGRRIYHSWCEMGFLAVHGFLHINGAMITTPEEEVRCLVYKKKFWQPMDSQDNKRKWKNRDLISSLEFAITGFLLLSRKNEICENMQWFGSSGYPCVLFFRCHESNGSFSYWAFSW